MIQLWCIFFFFFTYLYLPNRLITLYLISGKGSEELNPALYGVNHQVLYRILESDIRI